MVSTRQSCSSTTGGDHSSGETSSGGVKTRQSSGGGGGSTPAQNNSPSVLWQNVVIGESPNQPPNYLSKVHFLDLPQEIFDKIFGYVGYKSVSQLRLVCRQFDRVCSVILNSTFQRLQTQMLQRFQGIKAKMPRRESARRNHPLACESDIIETLHMRLTLLQMSFGKHIERKHCCFFAGEILDEVYRILLYIKVTPKLARPYRVTDELFDLSTMAMEYFKERIEPTLPEISYFGTDFLDFTNGLPTTANKTWMLDSPPHNSTKIEYESPGSNDERPIETTSPQPQSNTVLRKRIRKIKQGMKKYNSQLTLVKRELRTCKNKLSDQQKQFLEFASRMDEHDKKNEETSRKFSTLLQELNKCKTELQYWRSKFPHSSMCVSCGKLISGCAGGAFTEELLSRSSSFGGQYMVASGQQAAALDDPQPSTSSSSPSSPISTPTHHSEEMVLQSSQPHQIASPPLNPNGINSIGGKKMSNVNEEINAVKANNHQMAIKRKLMIPNEPASGHSKKVKKSNSMLKLRSKRS